MFRLLEVREEIDEQDRSIYIVVIQLPYLANPIFGYSILTYHFVYIYPWFWNDLFFFEITPIELDSWF